MLDSDLATTYHFVSEAGCVGESAPIFVESIVCTGEQANIFTPNNDGTNDTYDFKSWSYSIEVVRIYNRWGQLVRELIDEPFVWNGKSLNGDQAEDGVYFIVLSSRVPVDGEYTRTGVVYVKR
jgi:gliding motility-associated-like protein